MSRFSRWLVPATTVRAHCDLPCGVYDPEQARIEAESCYRIIEKYAANEDASYRIRAIAIKERQADLVKHHLDVLWHDYFKPEHLEKVPNLHELFWNATKQVSKVKASTDLADAKKLLDQIDEIDAQYDDDVLSVILPEFIPSKWWQHLLHNQTALAIKAALLFRKGVVVISVPYHLEN